jgi:protein arginine kinase activator
MQCERCGERPATVHYTQIINGYKTELHLCQECAAAQGVFGFGEPQFTFQDFLGKLLEDQFRLPSQFGLTETRCSNCGLTYNDFRRLGQLGCSECYTQFARQLNPLLRRLHGSDRHVGKVPGRVSTQAASQRELERLRGELQEAIKTENYERAAKLRDLIHEMERTISHSGD